MEHWQNPRSIFQHNDRLSHESPCDALERISRLRPRHTAIFRDLGHDDSTILISRLLRRVEEPDITTRRRSKKDRVLAASPLDLRDLLGGGPCRRVGGLAREPDADVREAFLGAAEPGAEQGLVRELEEVGGVGLDGWGGEGGGVEAWGSHGGL